MKEKDPDFTQSFLEKLLFNLPVAVFVKTADKGRFVYYNKVHEYITGVSAEQAIGNTDYDIGIPKEQADFFRRKDKETFEKGKVEIIPEESLDTPHLGRRILRTIKAPIFDDQGKPLYLLGISEDITVAKQNEEELKKYREQLEELVTERTAALEKTNEILKAEIAERKKAEEELKKHRDHLEELVEERTNKILKQKEEILTINENLEQQKAELLTTLEHLRNTQAQLIQSEKMASIGQLVAGIAHEINNPVTFISGGVESLRTSLEEVGQVLSTYHRITVANVKEKLKEIDELKEKIDYKEALREINNLIESIKAGTERTTEIVKGLRTFSRLDEDVLKVANIHEGLDSTLILLRNKYKHCIEIEKHYGDVPEIECYPGQLNQVFMNILSNAIDAIDGKGSITINTIRSNEQVQISIRDTGRGIPDTIRSKIFEPFFTTKEVGHGTGLGLSISHGIIEKHSGTIKFISEAGKGSEFIISLPIRQRKR
jgi:PAS domain S-box-containing protein